MSNRNTFTAVFVVLLLAGLTVAGIWAYRYQPPASSERQQPRTDGELIGGQTDEHGCLIAAGYSWCEAKQKCLRAWEEVCGSDPSAGDIASIRQAFMDKYGKNENEVQVTVNMFDGNYARGGVKFAPLGEPGEGGIFLAYKEENDSWKLAFDGNGMYSCSEMSGYGFPDSMLPDCADGDPGVLDSAQMANPASVYCGENGGAPEIRANGDGSQYGVCVFPDGSECDEWSFFRGECVPGNVNAD